MTDPRIIDAALTPPGEPLAALSRILCAAFPGAYWFLGVGPRAANPRGDLLSDRPIDQGLVALLRDIADDLERCLEQSQ